METWSDCLAVTGRLGRYRYCDWDDRGMRQLPSQLLATPVDVRYLSDLESCLQLVSRQRLHSGRGNLLKGKLELVGGIGWAMAEAMTARARALRAAPTSIALP